MLIRILLIPALRLQRRQNQNGLQKYKHILNRPNLCDENNQRFFFIKVFPLR